ncbi:unnamed protein product [Linum tenue]|uniref:Uncharacterized protein n=1 Tax=Linum tenue TaxID=586396 RepID=A0AAV0LC10_9ROSI|nr:unnamed protein product [Linum tenue]
MRRAEKRKKILDALLKSRNQQSPEREAKGDDETPAFAPTEEFDVNLIPDDYGLQIGGSSSPSSDNEGDGGVQKLSRAQRKRLRKKKIKEDVSRRKGIIGPLLPGSPPEEAESSLGVRQNAQQSGEGDGGNSRGERPRLETPNASRIKQRRKAKKLAKEKLVPPPCSNLGVSTSLNAVDDGNSAPEEH